MEDRGLELPQKYAGNTGFCPPGGAESGALCAPAAHFAPDLIAVIQAWPNLPEALKAGILAMIQAATAMRS